MKVPRHLRVGVACIIIGRLLEGLPAPLSKAVCEWHAPTLSVGGAAFVR